MMARADFLPSRCLHPRQVRPFMKRANKESRRVAELLSQLPTDLDVEAMVNAVLQVCEGPHVWARLRACLHGPARC